MLGHSGGGAFLVELLVIVAILSLAVAVWWKSRRGQADELE
jgi:hypothetical protein